MGRTYLFGSPHLSNAQNSGENGPRAMKLFAVTLSNQAEFCDAVFCPGQGRILKHNVIAFSFAIGFVQQENNLLAREPLLFETSFGAVKIFDSVAFLESAFERLEHHGIALPVLIATNTARDLGVLNANVRHHLNRFVVLSEIAKWGPIVVVLNCRTKRQQRQKND